MNTTYKMNTSVDVEIILEHARYEIFQHLLLVIVCMVVFGAIGIVGNSFAFAFYAFKSKPSSTVRLIACLAMVDLIVCVEFIPNIIEMWVNVKYTASFMCKFAHFIGLWTVACSGLILWVVAIDRHRKICSPFGKQMTLVTVKYAVIAIVIFGFALSVRNFANFDSVVVNVKDPRSKSTVKGHYCTTRDDSDYVVSVTIFTVIDFLLMLMVWITLAVAYPHIIYTIYKLKRIRKRLHNKTNVNNTELSNPSYLNEENDESTTQIENGPEPLNDTMYGHEEHVVMHEDNGHCHENDNSDKISILETNVSSPSPVSTKVLAVSLNDCQASVQSQDSLTEHGISTEDSQQYTSNMDDLSSSHDTEHLPENKHSSSTKTHAKSTLKRMFHKMTHKKYNSAKCPVERNLTFKMLVVSLVFIICFTPYFIVKILMRDVLKSGEEYELNLLAQIALRLPYMNSVFNPMVYCVFNSQFRFYIQNILKTFFSKCFRKSQYLFKS
ncbi:D(2) dopamine receptor-like [Ruditapes philippinarum]|uniref:D(2) dopamine receptor-like n=1 Tax=Ruditapes philippinarum TaxID=129788 RepID=UPI00295A6F2B|nr:D(2) dopamine receptor-like [Ruditapes philippinarum]XP_060583080.1 D(2) dopamine receptor-like [Ruditapes philippinarum]